jgi:hypothetical protein
MNTCIVFQAADGQIRVTHPHPKTRLAGEPEKAWLDRIAAHAKQQDESLRVCTRLPDRDAAELPTRRFRNCWRVNGQTVEVDMPLARAQRMAEIRAERNRRLEASDGLMARAYEIGAQAEIEALKAKRQTLRDIPAVIDVGTISTPEELTAFQPEWPVD